MERPPDGHGEARPDKGLKLAVFRAMVLETVGAVAFFLLEPLLFFAAFVGWQLLKLGWMNLIRWLFPGT